MHLNKIVYSFILICLIFSVNVNGQINRTDNLNTITTAVPLLMIGPDARAGAMGDAGVSSTPDVSSMHWNPSKYAFIEKDMGVGI